MLRMSGSDHFLPVIHPYIHLSFRPSINIFKQFLWSHWANFAQISYEASLGWGNQRLLKWLQSVDKDGPDAHIW